MGSKGGPPRREQAPAGSAGRRRQAAWAPPGDLCATHLALGPTASSTVLPEWATNTARGEFMAGAPALEACSPRSRCSAHVSCAWCLSSQSTSGARRQGSSFTGKSGEQGSWGCRSRCYSTGVAAVLQGDGASGPPDDLGRSFRNAQEEGPRRSLRAPQGTRACITSTWLAPDHLYECTARPPATVSPQVRAGGLAVATAMRSRPGRSAAAARRRKAAAPAGDHHWQPLRCLPGLPLTARCRS